METRDNLERIEINTLDDSDEEMVPAGRNEQTLPVGWKDRLEDNQTLPVGWKNDSTGRPETPVIEKQDEEMTPVGWKDSQMLPVVWKGDSREQTSRLDLADLVRSLLSVRDSLKESYDRTHNILNNNSTNDSSEEDEEIEYIEWDDRADKATTVGWTVDQFSPEGWR